MSFYKKFGLTSALIVLTACGGSDAPVREPSGPVDGTVAQAFLDHYDTANTAGDIAPITITEGSATFYGYIKMTNTTVPAPTDIIGNVTIDADFDTGVLSGSVSELADINRTDGTTTGTYTSDLQLKPVLNSSNEPIPGVAGSSVTTYLVGTFANDTRDSQTNSLGNDTQPLTGDIYEDTSGESPVVGIYVGIDGQKVNHKNAGTNIWYQELYDVDILAEIE